MQQKCKTFPGGSDGKEFACNAGDRGSIPGLGRCPGGGHGNLFQYSCLENSVDRRAWQVTVHGVEKSRTLLNDSAQHSTAKMPAFSTETTDVLTWGQDATQGGISTIWHLRAASC